MDILDEFKDLSMRELIGAPINDSPYTQAQFNAFLRELREDMTPIEVKQLMIKHQLELSEDLLGISGAELMLKIFK